MNPQLSEAQAIWCKSILCIWVARYYLDHRTGNQSDISPLGNVLGNNLDQPVSMAILPGSEDEAACCCFWG